MYIYTYICMRIYTCISSSSSSSSLVLCLTAVPRHPCYPFISVFSLSYHFCVTSLLQVINYAQPWPPSWFLAHHPCLYRKLHQTVPSHNMPYPILFPLHYCLCNTSPFSNRCQRFLIHSSSYPANSRSLFFSTPTFQKRSAYPLLPFLNMYIYIHMEF
jgi:hypothetical protein